MTIEREVPVPGNPFGTAVVADRVLSSSARVVRVHLPGLRELANPNAYLAKHSRSFRFAAAMMPRSHRARVARVYTWCRYTDNLVDDDVSPALAERRLDDWLARSRQAYDGHDSGIELVNHVMSDMAEPVIPFAY